MPSSWVGKIRQAATTGQGEFVSNPNKFIASNRCNGFTLRILPSHKRVIYVVYAAVNAIHHLVTPAKLAMYQSSMFNTIETTVMSVKLINASCIATPHQWKASRVTCCRPSARRA
jgi:hypothetical protein